MKYKCLVFDHDDTAVDSTREIHYPCFLETVKRYRPGNELLNLESFMDACFYPGLYDYYTNELHLTKEELDDEVIYWQNFVKKIIPDFFDGIGELLREYRNRGGIIAISSQSHNDIILRDYKNKLGFIPDEIYGYDIGKEKAKPNPFAIYDLISKYSLNKEDILVVDDLRTGLEMAKSAECDFAAAGWCHFVPKIHDFMKANSKFYFSTVREFSEFLLEE